MSQASCRTPQIRRGRQPRSRRAGMGVCARTRTTWPRSRRALEDAGIKFIDRGKSGGPGVRLKE